MIYIKYVVFLVQENPKPSTTKSIRRSNLQIQLTAKNYKYYTSLGNFFAQREIPEKTLLNPYRDWVCDLSIKITKKRKKIPFGIFSVRLVSFLRQNRIGIFQRKTSNEKIGVTNASYKCDSTYRQGR